MADHVVCAAAEIAPGERRIVELAGRSIGVFNVGGRFYALHNGCPHKGGELCAGRITGTVLPTSGRDFVYGREGEILRCSRHGSARARAHVPGERRRRPRRRHGLSTTAGL
jgi:nitrite reductase (NADH) small subunit